MDCLSSLRSEIHFIKMTSYLSAIFETLSRNGRYFCLYAVILFYYIDGQNFRAGDLYVTVGLLNALTMHVLTLMAIAFKATVQASVTFKRITVCKFMYIQCMFIFKSK